MAIPRIGLIGVGNFGINYLKHLQELANGNQILFSHVAVASEERMIFLQGLYPNLSITRDYRTLFGVVDGFCIVTPPETHIQLVTTCLTHGGVLVEKPLTLSVAEAEALEVTIDGSLHTCMVAQLFRFHAVTSALREMLVDFQDDNLCTINATFINPLVEDSHRSEAFEFIHWFDLIHFLYPDAQASLATSTAKRSMRSIKALVPYQTKYGTCSASYWLGWSGEEKQRNLVFTFSSGRKIRADYLANTLELTDNNAVTVVKYVPVTDALKEELSIWLAVLAGNKANPVSVKEVLPALRVAEHLTRLSVT